MSPEGLGVPDLTTAAATDLVAELYGVRGTLAPLPGERDRNFRVDVDGRAAFVFKVANVHESPELLAAQHAALSHLASRQPAFRLPVPVPGNDGQDVHVVADTGGRRCLARMLTYLHGAVAGSVVPRPWDAALLDSVGRLAGLLAAGLSGFDHPAMHRHLKWDSTHAHTTLRDRLRLIDSASRRALVERVAARHDAVSGAFPKLRRSVIHNDANDYNLLVEKTGSGFTANGLIDFGDMIHSLSVAEASVAAAYALLEQPDPVGAVRRVALAFHREFPLLEAERDVLFDLIVGRLALSVAISAEQRSLDPDNAYLSISEAPAWRALEYLEPLPVTGVTAAIWRGSA